MTSDQRQAGRPVVLFTDFGASGPYVGLLRAVLMREAPLAPVIDLISDAPACNPRASSYLLAALAPWLPESAVVLAVVDPGVGGDRQAVVVECEGRLFVGPDNGLLSPLCQQAAAPCKVWRIDWRPKIMSATFHGRDLFAPVAARLASGLSPQDIGCSPLDALRVGLPGPDLAEVVYIDPYGNVMTGLRADGGVRSDMTLTVAGHSLNHARTYGDRPAGTAFWYVNSLGLVEAAVNGGHAARALGISIGQGVSLVDGTKG